MITEDEIIEICKPIIKKLLKYFSKENYLNDYYFYEKYRINPTIKRYSVKIAKSILDKIKEGEK